MCKVSEKQPTFINLQIPNDTNYKTHKYM